MEPWQIEALQALLETQVKEVEPGTRYYTSSSDYGTHLCHLVDKTYDGIQIEQIDTGEKWNKRVNLYTDEIPLVLKTLLTWYLDDVRQKQQQEATAEAMPGGDALGELGELLDTDPFF